VQCIGMDYSGKYVASSSTKGTIIRIFRTDTVQCIQELRRGMDNAMILSLNFNLQSSFLGCSSDSGTSHIFQVMQYQSTEGNNSTMSGNSSEGSSRKLEAPEKSNKKRLTFLKNAIPYFKSEWSSQNLRIKEKIVICDFNSAGNDVIIYVKHGRMYRATKVIGKKGKEKLKIISRINLVTGQIYEVDDDLN